MGSAAVLALAFGLGLVAQAPRPQPKPAAPPKSAPAQKIRDGVYRIGKIETDTTSGELRIPGTINSEVTILEFVANTIGGNKAYESALTVEATGVEFNTALLLLGVDPSRSVVPRRHFDTRPPAGDPLDIWIAWSANGAAKRVRIEQLLFNERTRRTLDEGPWVYTGSTMMDGKYLADVDGILIGFVHSPAPVIENPRMGASGAYGSIVMNKALGLAGGTKVTLIVKTRPRGRG
jgi:hypothetical protein